MVVLEAASPTTSPAESGGPIPSHLDPSATLSLSHSRTERVVPRKSVEAPHPARTKTDSLPGSPTALSSNPFAALPSSSSTFSFLSPTDSERRFEAIVAAENNRVGAGFVDRCERQDQSIRLDISQIQKGQSVECTGDQGVQGIKTGTASAQRRHAYQSVSDATNSANSSSNYRDSQHPPLRKDGKQESDRVPLREDFGGMGFVPPTFNPFSYLRRAVRSDKEKIDVSTSTAENAKIPSPAVREDGVSTGKNQNVPRVSLQEFPDQGEDSSKPSTRAASSGLDIGDRHAVLQKVETTKLGSEPPAGKGNGDTSKQYAQHAQHGAENQPTVNGRDEMLKGGKEGASGESRAVRVQLSSVLRAKPASRDSTTKKVRRRSRRKPEALEHGVNARTSVKRAQRDMLQEKWKAPSASEETIAWRKFMDDLNHDVRYFGTIGGSTQFEGLGRAKSAPPVFEDEGIKANIFGKASSGNFGIVAGAGGVNRKEERKNVVGASKREVIGGRGAGAQTGGDSGIERRTKSLEVAESAQDGRRLKRRSIRRRRASVSPDPSQRRSLPFWEMNAYESRYSMSREQIDEGKLRRTMSDESEYRSTEGSTVAILPHPLPPKGILRSVSMFGSDAESMAKTSRSTCSKVRFAELDSVFEYWTDDEEAGWDLEDDDVLGLPDRMHMVIKLAGKSIKKPRSFWHGAKSLIKFLQDVDCVGANMYKGDALRVAVFRYERIWLPMYCAYLIESRKLKGDLNSKMQRRMARLIRTTKKIAKLKENEPLFENVVPVPPIDVAWVWFLHRCSPKMYKADCERVFGVALHTQRKNAFKYEASGSPARNVATRKRWKEFVHAFTVNRSSHSQYIARHKYFPRHLWSYKVYDNDSDRVADRSLVPGDWEPRSSYNLFLAARRQRDLLSICANDDLTDVCCAVEPLTLYRYLTFLHLAGGKEGFLPMPDIEPILYSHMAASKSFYDDCTKIAGRLVDPDVINTRKVLESDQGAARVEFSDSAWRDFIEDDDLEYCLSDVYQTYRSPSRTRAGFLDLCISEGRNRVNSRRTRRSNVRHDHHN